MKLEAVGWELRTAISLARLLLERSDRRSLTEARDVLASARAKFASAETSADLRQADDLLQQLNSGVNL